MRALLFLMLLVIALLVALLYYGQAKLIYYPRRYAPSDLKQHEHFTKIAYLLDGAAQTAFYLPPKSADIPKVLWLLFHGNAALALDWSDTVKAIPDTDIGYLLVDFPGYGLNSGAPTPDSISTAAKAAYQAIAEFLKEDPAALEQRTGTVGYSLGAASALKFARDHRLRRTILLAPFTSTFAMARKFYGRPLCYLLRHHFDNDLWLTEFFERNSAAEAAILHGPNDEVVPFEMGQELYQSHSERMRFYKISDASHGTLLYHGAREFEEIFRAYSQVLREAGRVGHETK